MRRKPAVDKPIQVMMKQKITKESEGEEDCVFQGKQKRVLRSNGKNRNKRVKINGEGKTGKVVETEWDKMGPREQRNILKEQIVDMLIKAGWTIEYKQRQSRDYKDAIYTDREGRGYWSVTLAYKKLKEIIDSGEATERDILAFKPIPNAKLCLLFRGTMSARKNHNNSAARKVNNKLTTNKVTSDHGGTSSRTRQTLMGRNSAGKSNKSVTMSEVDGKVSSRRKQTLRGRRAGDEGGYDLYHGKRCLLSWMIDLGTVPLGGNMTYRKGRKRNLGLCGKIVKDGICCNCCNITHSVQEFETHANSDVGNPYQNTYLESGKSLLQCVADSWKKYVEINSIGSVNVDVDGADDPNDDRCNICGDGGNLICCDKCPSTFHKKCLNINIPPGDWNCVYCLCKFCGIDGESTSMSDGSQDLLSALFTCRLCEEKYHMYCTKEKTAEGLDHEDEDPSFCGNECQRIFMQLQVLLGVRSEPVEGFSHTVLQHREVSGEASTLDDDASVKVKSNAKLAVAFTVMDECFVPYLDELSGTNMIYSVVYNRGSNIRRLNYGGFYTIVLEKDDEIIAVASIRIHGSKLAEMPFIGTRYKYRRQGICTRLLTAIETLLNSLGVEKLVIPAISKLIETWTKVFGFHPIEKSERQEMKHMSIIVFPKTNMLQKRLKAQRSIKTVTSSDVNMVMYKRRLREKCDLK